MADSHMCGNQGRGDPGGTEKPESDSHSFSSPGCPPEAGPGPLPCLCIAHVIT